MSENIVLSWPNRADDATVSSPDTWVSTLPLSNLKDRVFSNIAKIAATSATINFSFADYTSVGTIALANHNLSTAATVRIYLYYDAAQTILLYDSGDVPAWTAAYDTLELEWESAECWDGLPTDAERKKFTTLFYNYADKNYGILSGRIVITDTSNTDGFLSFGRLFISRWFQPSINASYGFERGFKTSTQISDCNDTEYFRRRRPRRIKTVALDRLNENEALSQVLDAQRSQGVDKELLYSDQFTKNQYSLATSFIGRLSDLSPISQPYYTTLSAKINLIEVL